MSMIRLSARRLARPSIGAPLGAGRAAAGVLALRGLRTATPFINAPKIVAPQQTRSVSHQPKTSAENPVSDPILESGEGY